MKKEIILCDVCGRDIKIKEDYCMGELNIKYNPRSVPKNDLIIDICFDCVDKVLNKGAIINENN